MKQRYGNILIKKEGKDWTKNSIKKEEWRELQKVTGKCRKSRKKRKWTNNRRVKRKRRRDNKRVRRGFNGRGN